VLVLAYLESAIAVPLALHPRSDILRAIRLQLLAYPLFEAVDPLTLVNGIVILSQKLDHTVAISFIVLEPTRIDVFSWLVLIPPSYLLPLARMVDHPSSKIKLALVVPNYRAFLVQNK
jgi:hypothetical protein